MLVRDLSPQGILHLRVDCKPPGFCSLVILNHHAAKVWARARRGGGTAQLSGSFVTVLCRAGCVCGGGGGGGEEEGGVSA